MAGPKKSTPRGDPAYEQALASVQTDPTLTESERQRLLSGDAGIALYRQENNIDNIKFDKRQQFAPGTKQLAPEGFTALDIASGNGAVFRQYFTKAYDKIKKEKQMSQERQKLLQDQPGLGAQTSGTALSPASTTTLGGYKP